MRNMDEIFKDAQELFVFLSEAEDCTAPADIILAMGSQDLRVADLAAQAYFAYRARWLVCSGGFGKDTEALFCRPEGVLYAERCLRLDVPEERVLVEDKAANSGENFRFSRALLARRGVTPQTGVIACKPYMAKRALATGRMQWPEVDWSVARQRTSLTEYLKEGNDVTAVLELMVGDLQRLRVYAGSFQVPVEVPAPVWNACKRLAGDGYDRFVIGEI